MRPTLCLPIPGGRGGSPAARRFGSRWKWRSISRTDIARLRRVFRRTTSGRERFLLGPPQYWTYPTNGCGRCSHRRDFGCARGEGRGGRLPSDLVIAASSVRGRFRMPSNTVAKRTCSLPLRFMPGNLKSRTCLPRRSACFARPGRGKSGGMPVPVREGKCSIWRI